MFILHRQLILQRATERRGPEATVEESKTAEGQQMGLAVECEPNDIQLNVHRLDTALGLGSERLTTARPPSFRRSGTALRVIDKKRNEKK